VIATVVQFVEILRSQRLLSADQIASLSEETAADARGLARLLVQRGWCSASCACPWPPPSHRQNVFIYLNLRYEVSSSR